MATTKGVFDLPIEASIEAFSDEIDDLHEVQVESDPVMAGMGTMSISMLESPLWSYFLAAVVGAAPFVLAAALPWVNIEVDEDGIRFLDDWAEDFGTLATVGAVALVVGCLAGAFVLATRFKRPVHQATVTLSPEPAGNGTKVRVDGRPDPYVYRALRRVFDEHDRDEIQRREGQATAMSVVEFFEFGPGGGRSLLGAPRRGAQPAEVAADEMSADHEVPASPGESELAGAEAPPDEIALAEIPAVEVAQPTTVDNLQGFIEGAPVRPPESH